MATVLALRVLHLLDLVSLNGTELGDRVGDYIVSPTNGCGEESMADAIMITQESRLA